MPEYFTPKLFSLLSSGYSLRDMRSDMLAGLTVAIVALPLSMALAIASGASPEQGLVTAVIAGFFISLLGGSRVQIGGPTGAFIVVVFDVIATHGYDGLLLATLMAGVMLIIAGYAGLGQVIRYIPYPVVTGFTAGIAVIIASSQVVDFLGLQIADVPAGFISKWASYTAHIGTLNIPAVLTGVGALAVIVLLRRFAPRWPNYLLAILLTALVISLFHIPVETVGARFPVIPSGLPAPSLPDWSWPKFVELVPSAITIAFLAGVESLLSAVVADGMTGFKHRPNQELVAQGVANIASCFFGGLPATGAIARTATNIRSGAKTPMAGIFHAAFILLFMVFAAEYIAYIPLAALSAILFVVAWNMSEHRHFMHIFRLSKSDRAVMVLTFVLTVLIDLTVAIGVGVTIASLVFVHHMSQSGGIRAQGRAVRDYDGADSKGDIPEDPEQRDYLPEGVEVFRFTGPLFFGMAGTMMETLQAIGDRPKTLILRMRLVSYMDVAGSKALADVIRLCHSQHKRVILSAVQQQPGEMLKGEGLVHDGDMLHIVPSYDAAITLARDTSEG